MDLTGAKWFKSSLSGDNGGNCVEVAELTDTADGPAHKAGHPDLIAVRDSKDPTAPSSSSPPPSGRPSSTV